jgi:hypothetical protein
MREDTHCGDEVTCGDLFALVGAHLPQVRRIVEFGAGHARVELDVALEIVTFGDVFKITEDFRLLGIAFRPFPLLQKLLVPGKAINV